MFGQFTQPKIEEKSIKKGKNIWVCFTLEHADGSVTAALYCTAGPAEGQDLQAPSFFTSAAEANAWAESVYPSL